MCPLADKGFTLLEFLLALVLTAILAAMAGAGVVSGFNLFTAARDNTHITQKANLALTRLTRELREITNVIDVNASHPYLIYEKVDNRKAVALDDGKIKLFSNVGTIESMNAAYVAANGDILIDNVTSFSLSYYDGDNAWQTSPSLGPIRQLSTIEFQFIVGRDTLGGRSVAFGNTVHLRNNNNYGGAAPPPNPPTQSNYPCFIGMASNFEMHWLWCPFLLIALLPLLLLSLRRRQTKLAGTRAPMAFNTRGAALIAVVVVLVVFSALAIVMLPMITTSQYTQLGQDAAGKAYYLAESGYRYAASQYLNAGSDGAKNAALEGLHRQSFSLLNNAGSFQLEVYPYYGYVESDPGGTSALTIRLPGGLTTDLFDDGSGYNAFSGGGSLQIGVTTFSYSGATVTTTPPEISFTMDATMPSVPVNTDVYFVGQTTADTQQVSLDGSDTIEMAAGSTNTFPLLNGEVVIDDNVYAYRENIRSNTVNAQLVGITDPEDPTAPALNLDPGTDVILSKFVDLQSTGSYGISSINGERLLTYHVPLPTSKFAQHRLEFRDTFDDPSHWTTNIWGSQTVAEFGGDNALSISGYSSTIHFPRISLAALNWTTTEIDLEWIHQRADYFLSYDAQVKIGFKDTDLVDTPTPDWGFTPAGSDIPTYFAAGISFRLDDDDTTHNAYGLSLMRGNKDAPAPYDNLPNGLLDASLNDKLVILLWQQTSNGDSQTWLAYKEIGDVEIFSEEVESGTNGWTSASPWGISSTRSHGGANSWHFDRDGVTSEVLISPEIIECDYDYLWLSYYSWHAKAAGDTLAVEFRSHDGSVWSAWNEIDRLEDLDSGGVWALREAGVRVDPGAPVQFRFRYETDTGDTDSYAGWFIDDIRIGGDWPVQEATLALRIQEAPSLRFTNGGTYEIQRGDLIYQGTTASAMVDADPIVTSGSWGASTAAGHLVLKNLSGTFNLTQRFSVLGGGDVGTVQAVRGRDNFIRAYYGSPDGCGIPNADDLDNERHANPRDAAVLNWPPADGVLYTDEADAFTLIQWDSDKINTSVSSLDRLTATQLRSNESVLLTPDSPLGQTRPELGLHALGKGVENIYFDDFGLTVTFQGPVDITSPLQE